MLKIRTKKVVFFVLPPKLITIIFLRRPILDLKFPLMCSDEVEGTPDGLEVIFPKWCSRRSIRGEATGILDTRQRITCMQEGFVRTQKAPRALHIMSYSYMMTLKIT